MTTPTDDVVDLILNDHREVERLFEELRSNPATRANNLPVLISLLTAHSRAEEAEVYPVAASEAGAGHDVEHSQEEHIEADQLLAKLAETDHSSPEFETVLREVVDSITHHVEEEEAKVLPAMRSNLTDARRAELGEAFLSSREKHLGEMPSDIRKSELDQQAANVGLSGASSMSKAQTERALQEKAEESEE
ncbi:hemerythrin domain-containing protein [Occultella glacieicola]|uniref:Hemerythrin domain-containing protein n=1 Tax=Occultella glacieicola TaxID=2518684 RepID=A0ABY2E0T9_9MICO|nr:hemerythrin domain-containing protein [Occultella glacieicola]TDE91540.1 hemerythrin domain-containing protein [Occultella glacieicola]